MRGRAAGISQQLRRMGTLPSLRPPLHRPGRQIRTFRTRWTFALPLAAAVAALAIGVSLWLHKTEYFWRNPIADARFQTVTDFDGLEQAAAVSRDGHFVAFLSDRDGPDGRLGHASRFG